MAGASAHGGLLASVVVSVGGLIGRGSMNYSAPEVHNASSVDSGGGAVTVYGAHFGFSGAEVSIGGTLCEDVMYVDEHAAVRCRAGGVSGEVQSSYSVVVTLSGQSGQATYAYAAPRVDEASAVGTAGGDVTVRGRGFGGAGAVVVVGGRACEDVRYLTNRALLSSFRQMCLSWE